MFECGPRTKGWRWLTHVGACRRQHEGEIVENDNNQTAASAPNNSQGKNSTTTEKTILASGTTAPAAPANPAQDLPLALQVKKDVNRYLGSGQEYKEWSQTLVSLEEKGVLAEILREKALRLHIQAEEYKTLQ